MVVARGCGGVGIAETCLHVWQDVPDCAKAESAMAVGEQRVGHLVGHLGIELAFALEPSDQYIFVGFAEQLPSDSNLALERESAPSLAKQLPVGEALG